MMNLPTDGSGTSGGSGQAVDSKSSGNVKQLSSSVNPTVSGFVDSGGDGSATPGVGLMQPPSNTGLMRPPPSQPTLAGGSGTGGHGMGMTSIQEEDGML